jgi:hypothetical protein
MPKPDYNLFISWSGERSRFAASALRDWIPKVVQAVEPFMSEADIDKGSRGLNEIARALEGVKLGISCLTPENLNASWLLYEAGALTKTVDDATKLCTFLLGGLQPKDVKGPLSMFQATKADKEDVRKLIRTINKAVSKAPMPEGRLDQVFDGLWPQLEEELKRVPNAENVVQTPRPTEDMVAEILEIVRADVNRRKQVDWMDEYIPVFKDFLPLLQQIVQAAKQAGAAGAQASVGGTGNVPALKAGGTQSRGW